MNSSGKSSGYTVEIHGVGSIAVIYFRKVGYIVQRKMLVHARVECSGVLREKIQIIVHYRNKVAAHRSNARVGIQI